MKKMLMGVLAMLLVLTMGTTVFASPSPNPDTGLDRKAQEWNNKVEHVAATGANNQIYNVTKKRVDASKVNSVNEVIKTVSSQAEVIGMSDLSVDKGVDTSKGIKVTLSIDPKSIINGYSVYVVHQYGEGKWETVKPSSVTRDGKVTVTLYSLSPVAIVQYPNNVSVPISDPSKNKPDSTNNTNNNTNSTENSNSNTTNSNNTSGPSQSNSNSSNSSNSNNQSNSQTNNQNNPVNVKQNVTVNYPDRDSDSYDNGYSDGYSDGRNSVKGTSASSNGVAASGGTTSAGVLSPKTGASLPALPIVAVFALAGIVVCGKKAHANR
ncbi:MAG: hypothetical protein PUJ27_07875 [Lachnobacterium sp.]|nr:hypothetical protein [Lachnobacterium sp.]MDD7713804.1 hypothetical protein [Lachnobacterium sp.]MDY5461782.1 hypothetical protein [Agathobacter sp.]